MIIHSFIIKGNNHEGKKRTKKKSSTPFEMGEWSRDNSQDLKDHKGLLFDFNDYFFRIKGKNTH